MQNMDPVEENSNSDHTQTRKLVGSHNKVCKAILIHYMLWFRVANFAICLYSLRIQTYLCMKSIQIEFCQDAGW